METNLSFTKTHPSNTLFLSLVLGFFPPTFQMTTDIPLDISLLMFSWNDPNLRTSNPHTPSLIPLAKSTLNVQFPT